MAGSLKKVGIGVEDCTFEDDELYPASTWERQGSLGILTGLTKLPNLLLAHQTIVNAKYFNSGALTDATIQAAIDHVGTDERTIYLEPGTWVLSAAITGTANIYFQFAPGAYLQPATGITFTAYSPAHIIASPRQQIIDTTNNSTDPLLFTMGGSDASPIYPHWFGIDGTADQVEINLAIDAKEDDSVIELSPGAYSIAAEILFTGDRMKFKGYGATITLAANSDCHMLAIDRPNTDQTIEGIKFDGNSTNQGVGNWNIMYTGGTDTGEPERLRILNCKFVNADYVAINLESAAECLFDHNFFDNSGYGHIRLHGDDNSVVSNNHFDAVLGDYSYMAISLDGKYTTVIGNTFENIPDTAYALRFIADGANPVRGNKIISNNFLGDNGGGYAITFDNIVYPTDTIISENIFYQVIGINASGPRTKVIGNSFIDGGSVWYPSGVNLNITFSNNTVSGTSSGLRVKYTDGIISGNTFYDIEGPAILMEGTSNCIVEGNIFRDIGTGTDDTYGVIALEREGVVEANNNIITHNICYSDNANTPSAFVEGTFDPVDNKVINNIIQDTHDTLTQTGSALSKELNDIRNNAGHISNNHIYTNIVTLTAAQVKNLAVSGKSLMLAPGAGKIIEFVSATIAINYSGTGNWAEPSDPDDLVIEYGTSGVDVSATIAATGFIDQTNDEMRWVKPIAITDTDLVSSVNKYLVLLNTGTNYTDNGGTPTSTMVVTTNYRIHDTGL